jgi:hypothetical protein
LGGKQPGAEGIAKARFNYDGVFKAHVESMTDERMEAFDQIWTVEIPDVFGTAVK